jgi:ABC-type transport system substrate-binding protein
VLNPIGIPRDMRDTIEGNEHIRTFVNPDYNMFYLAFNLRKYPMSEYEFRQVFDIIIDKELVIKEVLGEVVLPLYSTMPAMNVFWHNPELSNDYMNLSRAERVELAVGILKDAGWRWRSEPYWDEFVQDIVPGEGLIMPNGEPMPALTILGPGPDFDIVRATFNQWVSEWARELGMPIQSELTGRNAILDSVFVASDFDMYIFGWPLGNPAYPDYYNDFWHSRNCTFETGGSNTPCFKNDEYDALVDEFITTGDLQRAQELVYKMQLILADQRPYIPLYSDKVFDFAWDNVLFPYVDMLGGIELQDGFRTSTQVMIPK